MTTVLNAVLVYQPKRTQNDYTSWCCISLSIEKGHRITTVLSVVLVYQPKRDTECLHLLVLYYSVNLKGTENDCTSLCCFGLST